MSKSFAQELLAWFNKHGRKDLPWQHPRLPYYVWLSEIMLQQTQVVTVIPYFKKFITRFPDVESLANATQDEVLTYWAGLGYYSRARNLHRAAQMIQQDFQGRFPQDLISLQTLPGIGRSTAGAILAQAFNDFGVILDGNVKRVLSRYHATHDQKNLWELATQHTPQKSIADYAQAIMDLGAMICTRSKPKCDSCPLQKNCVAFATQTVGEYPAKKKRPKIPEREKFFILMMNEKNEILLERQPSPGIWGGLWSLPSVQDLKELNLPKQALKHLPSLNHTFTHFKLKLKPVMLSNIMVTPCVMEALPQQWISIEQLEGIGLPAPIKTILKKIKE